MISDRSEKSISEWTFGCFNTCLANSLNPEDKPVNMDSISAQIRSPPNS